MLLRHPIPAAVSGWLSLSAVLVLGCGQRASSTAGPGDGGAGLTSFSISPLALTPPFSPDIHDYYVRCAPQRNTLSVAVSARAGATVSLTQPVTTPASTSLTASLQLTENQAIVASASNGSESAEYWVRCLPFDFPTLEMVPHPDSPDAGVPTPGYYLLGDTDNAKGESAYAMVVDGNGVPVWYSLTANGQDPVDVESLAPNSVSFVGYLQWTFADFSWKYEVHDLATNGVTYVEPVGEPLDLHELQLLSNGDYLALSDPITTGNDLTGLASFGANADMLGCRIQELSPSGGVVWQWTATDHFDPVKDTTYPATPSVAGKPVADPFHCNSIDVAADGDLLISARDMDSVFLISKTTGKVLWKMGGTPYTKDGATYLTVTGDPLTSFYRQHDARFLPDNQISLFDDETGMAGPARGVIYTYDVNAGTATFAWQYLGAVSSSAMGSFRVLPDGSRIIGWGEGNTSQLGFTEVDANGNDLLELHFTDGDESYRALKVPLTQLDLTLMRNSVNGPLPQDAGTGATGRPYPVPIGAGDDGGLQDATIPVETGAACHAVSGSGASEHCSYASGTTAGFACPITGGSSGSCPSSGLFGCCVETISEDGGGQLVDATCYYSSATGQPAASQCALEAYQGLPYNWQTIAP
ncbi:MAG TPA: arylsulfotransferase family protein [Polyangiaceae bacterium]